ncbi:MAG TPA: hypothetical protein VG753_02340 [Candidatus Paceibacterota bacterium]|nr:hypothetical protein [Candidatus Paceibacterota bacterium]
MKAYIQKLQDEKTPHERRQLALQVAGVVTALLFVGWLGTLGVRLSELSTAASQQTAGGNAAATLIAVQGEASSTSDLGY